MYYPLYNNPFYYPNGAYMNNMCSYGAFQDSNTNNTPNFQNTTNDLNTNSRSSSKGQNSPENNILNNGFFSIDGDRLDIFGISINIDDLIILIMLFFMLKENQIDYSIIIILALILFDQS